MRIPPRFVKKQATFSRLDFPHIVKITHFISHASKDEAVSTLFNRLYKGDLSARIKTISDNIEEEDLKLNINNMYFEPNKKHYTILHCDQNTDEKDISLLHLFAIMLRSNEELAKEEVIVQEYKGLSNEAKRGLTLQDIERIIASFPYT